MHPVLPRLVALFAVGIAPAALAHGSYGANVPNYAVQSCQTCHGTGGSTTFNPFGTNFRTAVDASSVAEAWAAVFDLDSDSDGQPNGEELGDPCGVFTAGGTPARSAQISHPGDPASTSATPSAPDGDDDAVSDGCDNCPADANTDQGDDDDDGTGDACEAAAEGEGEGEGEGEEGEGEGDGGGEGEGEGDDGGSLCSSARVTSSSLGSPALASLLLFVLVATKRR